MRRAQIRREARYLATSSKKFMNAPRFQLIRGAKASIGMPRARARSMYSMALEIANAISCTAVAPDSRM